MGQTHVPCCFSTRAAREAPAGRGDSPLTCLVPFSGVRDLEGSVRVVAGSTRTHDDDLIALGGLVVTTFLPGLSP